jgi:hypothetical protein
MSNRYKWLLGSGLLLIMLVISFFAIRNPLLRYVINNRIKLIEQRIGADIAYQTIAFHGLTGVQINRLCVLPSPGDTLLQINKINVAVNALSIPGLKLRVNQVIMDQPHMRLWRRDGKSNYLFLFQSSEDTLKKLDTTARIRDYNELVKSIFGPVFRYIPRRIEIRQAQLNADMDDYSFELVMDDLTMHDGRFSTLLKLMDNGQKKQWKVDGGIDSQGHTMNFKLASNDTLPFEMPYLEYRWDLLLAFDSLQVSLSYSTPSNELSILKGKAMAWQQVIHHPDISPYDVNLSRGFTNFNFRFGQSWAEVDSATSITYNNQRFHLFARYDQLPENRIQLFVNETNMDAQAFFGSLPAGLFTNLAGIKVSGTLDFNLIFDYYPRRPDSLVFHSALESDDFKLLRYGATNFAIINDPFIYTAWEKGVPVRSWMVGPENPDFRPLDQFPAHLKYAIMTSEDGAFYHHRGFIPDAIRESIITNLKQKRFARGGSTISMQLVKNVFLNRNKTITRKLEEMLITWLIEHERLVSKDRMLEVYLNIIETGPGIYGMTEAARYYFNKEVKNLNLAESIFLASIVPRPKAFKYSFTEDGKLKPYLESYYSLVSSKMMSKGWIPPEAFNSLEPEVVLSGPAKYQIAAPLDTIPESGKEKRGFFNFEWLKKH